MLNACRLSIVAAALLLFIFIGCQATSPLLRLENLTTQPIVVNVNGSSAVGFM